MRNTVNRRLPVELYRDIVQQVERKYLPSILTTSRAISHEVERILYRHLKFDLLYPGKKLTIKHFLHLKKRIAFHVYSLQISGISSLSCPRVRNILESVPNLKDLSLYFHLHLTPFIECIPELPPFRLHTFQTSHGGDRAFTLFLRSQPHITRFSWFTGRDPHVSISPMDVPALKILHSSNTVVLASLLPSQQIRCLLYSGKVTWLLKDLVANIAISSVRSLELDYLIDLDAVADLFPNLEFLGGRGSSNQDHILDTLPRFSKLRKLRLIRNTSERLERRVCADLASQFFERQCSLEMVELYGNQWLREAFSWRFTRGLVCGDGSGDHIDLEEWRTW